MGNMNASLMSVILLLKTHLLHYLLLLLRSRYTELQYAMLILGEPAILIHIKVKIGNEHCGKTSVKSETNNPTWNEVISCKNYQFNSSSPPRITFEAYDQDSLFTWGDDFIGSGSIVIDTKSGDYDGNVKLHKQDCDEDGILYFRIHLKQV